MLAGEELAGAETSALDLIADHHRAGLVADAADLLQEGGGHRDEAGFTLHGFDEDAGEIGRVHLADERIAQGTDAVIDVFLLGHLRRPAV